MMNKVVSIEIARQVFWIEESAYGDLKVYLQKIRQQLVDDECASEIYNDIELRIAELLFEGQKNLQKAITVEQINDVTQQVGFIDSKSNDEELPRKSFRDTKNKILAGVCAGLAVRLGVPAFLLRVLFIALTAAFGLGIVLYLVFLISLDSNVNRIAALEAQGKARTARQIATFEEPVRNPILQLQRIIFLPFSLIGALATITGDHFVKRKRGYRSILKNSFAAALFISAFLFTQFLFLVNEHQLLPWPISWGLSVGAMYVVVLILSVYIREYYMPKPNKKIDKRLKIAALVPIVLIGISIVYIENTQAVYHNEIVEKTFQLEEKQQLTIKLNQQRDSDKFSRAVNYVIKTNNLANKEIKLLIDYSSYGKDSADAKKNIQSLEFIYAFTGNELELNKYWSLKDGVLYKGQYVSVTIEVPQNTIIGSPWELTTIRDKSIYRYTANAREPVKGSNTNHLYIYLVDNSFMSMAKILTTN